LSGTLHTLPGVPWIRLPLASPHRCDGVAGRSDTPSMPRTSWRMYLRPGRHRTTGTGCTTPESELLCTSLDIVAVNDPWDAATLAHLLAHDSTYGGPRGEHPHRQRGHHQRPPHHVLGERNAANRDWGALGVDLVIESIGKLLTRNAAAAPTRQPPVAVRCLRG
jgi:hypothetical protein